MKSLQEFYQDKETRENVKEYIAQFYKEEGIRMLMKRENVAVADAIDLLEKAFENLDLLFKPKRKTKKIINEAR